MKKIYLALCTGVVAGIIDIIPMVIMQLNYYSLASAFVHWIILGFVITYIECGFSGWLKGLVIAVVLAVPICILLMQNDVTSVPPVLVMSVILGSFIGYLDEKYGN